MDAVPVHSRTWSQFLAHVANQLAWPCAGAEPAPWHDAHSSQHLRTHSHAHSQQQQQATREANCPSTSIHNSLNQ
eukprot:5574618-Amphidinium_carterae.1